jgi:hypothetical protein
MVNKHEHGALHVNSGGCYIETITIMNKATSQLSPKCKLSGMCLRRFNVDPLTTQSRKLHMPASQAGTSHTSACPASTNTTALRNHT